MMDSYIQHLHIPPLALHRTFGDHSGEDEVVEREVEENVWRTCGEDSHTPAEPCVSGLAVIILDCIYQCGPGPNTSLASAI